MTDFHATPFNPDTTRDKMLAWLFREVEKAGYGIANGTSFEAFPGCEDAAADYIEELIGK